jgi:ATP-dependent protease HslVU (ClpYQ) peptidase subunit
MTCIVAVSAKGKVYMGGDSALSDGTDLIVMSDEKVFLNGQYVIGFCGSYRMAQLLRYSLKPPQPRAQDIRQFMATKFIDAVRQTLSDGGYASKHNNVESGGRFLVGVKGRIFYVDEDYQIFEPKESYAAVGCGDQIAHGALYAQDVSTKPDERVRQALRAAERFSAGVRGPFVVRSV